MNKSNSSFTSAQALTKKEILARGKEESGYSQKSHVLHAAAHGRVGRCDTSVRPAGVGRVQQSRASNASLWFELIYQTKRECGNDIGPM